MSRIKNIYCFGTSFTAGGGFEWESTDKLRKYLLNKYYKNTPEPKKQFYYSWPGQLESLLKGVKVHNLAKQGYGNDSMYRKCFDIVRDLSFDCESSLFLFEFSEFGRKEFYYNKIKDYIVCNYHHEDDKLNQVDIGHSYYYDDLETNNKLDEFQPTIKSFIENSFDEMNEFHSMCRDISLFLNWLVSKKLNVIFTSEPRIYYEEDRKLIDTFPQINYEISSNDECIRMVDIISRGFRIKDETDLKYDDFHAGYEGNKYLSKVIYNNLIDLNYIDGDVFNLDDEYYKAKNSKYITEID